MPKIFHMILFQLISTKAVKIMLILFSFKHGNTEKKKKHQQHNRITNSDSGAGETGTI